MTTRSTGPKNRFGSGPRSGALGLWLTGGGAAIVALLLAMAPASGAVSPKMTLKSPYGGTLASTGNSGSIGGCSAKVTNPVKATWNSKNGSVTMSGTSKAGSCPGVNQGSNAYVSTYVTVAIPIPIAVNGTHTITIQWSWHVALPTSLKASGKCPSAVINANGYGSSYCSASAYANVNGGPHIEDLTNGTTWYPSNYWSGANNGSNINSNEYCYSGTCSFYNSTGHTVGGTGAGAFTWWINATLSKGDKVIVVLQVYGNANSDEYGFPAGTASSAFNLATLGNGGKLTSITVT
jgi:hypothetical protein